MGQIDNIKDVLGTEFVYSKPYYNNIFKKTEKIVSAVFFILQRHESAGKVKDENTLASEIKSISLSVLAHLSESLLYTDTTVRGHLLEVTRQLLLLNSYLSVAMTSGLVAPAYGSIISGEIGSVLNSISEYSEETAAGAKLGEAYTSRKERVVRTAPVAREGAATSETPLGDQVGRKERILAIVKEKGHVSIKDISEHIKDVSEKSIQRDLISLIEKGQVIRQGERRWSTYSLPL